MEMHLIKPPGVSFRMAPGGLFIKDPIIIFLYKLTYYYKILLNSNKIDI